MTRSDDRTPRPGPTQPYHLTHDAAIEQLMLDAQLVAHAQQFDRAAFRARSRLEGLKAVVVEIGHNLAGKGRASLRILGASVVVDATSKVVEMHRLSERLRVEARSDLMIWVGHRSIRVDNPIYSDHLYRQVESEVVSWLIAKAGDERVLWSRR